MAGSFSDFLEKKILDYIFGAVTYTPPATLYIGLSTTTVADDGTGITEPIGNSYSRASVTNNTTNFPSATGTTATKTTGADIVFTTPTGSWGNITDFFVSDALMGGNMLCHGTLGTPQTISSGNPVKFSTGSLTITQD